MATPTLANSSNLQQLFAESLRPFASLSYPKPHPEFRVCSTGKSGYHWRVVALPGKRTISLNKSLTCAEEMHAAERAARGRREK